MKAMTWMVVAGFLVAIVYLLFWPVQISPRTWTPSAVMNWEGARKPSAALDKVQIVAKDVGYGPQAVVADATGRVYIGYADGRVITLANNAATFTQLSDTHGRPMGVTFGPYGGVVVIDARKGLLHIGAKPDAKVISDGVAGHPLHFGYGVDDGKLTPKLFFTDASANYGYGEERQAMLAHDASGRLLQYNLADKKTTVLMDGLHFPTGVAVGPNDAYVLVAEAGTYQILRYWLTGPKAGTHDVFVSGLPGAPAQISFSRTNRLWVAIPHGREPLLDDNASSPFMLKVLARLPRSIQEMGASPSVVLGFNEKGQLVAALENSHRASYGPVTSVFERGAWFWFGSNREDALARLPLNQVMPNAPAPPMGWKNVTAKPHGLKAPPVHEDDDED